MGGAASTHDVCHLATKGQGLKYQVSGVQTRVVLLLLSRR